MRLGPFTLGCNCPICGRRVRLRPVVLAPDVQHENARDEQEGHHEDGNGADLKEEKFQGLVQIIKPSNKCGFRGFY